jgi:ceramide glucosyltransferase
MVAEILGGLTILSAGINIWQWNAAGRFPLHERYGEKNLRLGLSLLKPLKGADGETRACLESWFAQDYAGPVQILFGVYDADDPVCAIVRELIRLHPTRDAELVICEPLLGANAKVSTLTHLQKKARYDIFIVSDADVFAPADLISEIGRRFQDEQIALVNCFYKLPSPETFGGLWESIAVNADFWSQVCQSNSMKPMNFALGAVMAVRRSALEKINGFSSLLNQLADDYQLGRRVSEIGGKIALSNLVVECREEAKGFVEIWRHQLRWARTIRVCQPAPYFGSILSNVTIFALALFVVVPGCPVALGCLGIRIATAAHNQLRLTQRHDRLIESIFTPVKDVLSFLIWLLSFTGSTVTWRGETFYVKRGGELVRRN